LPVAIAALATVVVLASTTPASQALPTRDLRAATISDIQAAVDGGTLSYEVLVRMYLKRIDAYDTAGPKLNAVLQVHPRAIELARELDAERRATGRRSPLHGIPIAVKDSVDVYDIPSAGGNLALAGTFPTRDATVVQRLRDAGALIFLKTNLDEFNLAAEGLSSLGGQVLNPYDLARNPGGSSAGTGVAITAGFATVGIATETGASIRSPASNSSVVGLAPTPGLTSRAGVVPYSFTLDRVGVHARSVADAAIMLSVMRGFDAADLFTWESLGKLSPEPYESHLDAASLAGARIGVLRDLFRNGQEFSEVNGLIDEEVKRLGADGALVMDGLTTGMDLVGYFPSARVSGPEFRFAFDAYLARRGPDTPVKNLRELVATGKYLKKLEPIFTQALAAKALDFDAAYLARLHTRTTLRRVILEVMDRYGVEVLVYPFKGLGAPPLGTADRGPRDNPLSSIAGLPAVVVPAGVTREGLPIALEFLGRPFTEDRLLQIAAAYERTSGKRVPPRLVPPLPGEAIVVPR
jgi:Asp-tRNA(Asn)/Glu-tRNA(Gln) amidotransferase A subunit family amidase